MGSVIIVALASLLFFSVVGALHVSSMYRRVLRDLKPPRGFEWVWFDVPGFLALAIAPGTLVLFAPKKVERYTMIFVVVFLLTDEAITESQAREYLREQGIEGAI